MRCKKLEANWLESRWGEIGWKITSGSPDFLCFSKKKRIFWKPCRVDFFSGGWYKVIDKYHTQCIVPNHITTQPYRYISNMFWKYIKCTADLHNMKKRGNVLTAQPKKVNFCANLIFLGDRITLRRGNYWFSEYFDTSTNQSILLTFDFFVFDNQSLQK